MVLAIALMFWAVNSPAIVGVSAAKRVLPSTACSATTVS